MAPTNTEIVSAAFAADLALATAATPPCRWFYTQGGGQYGPVTGPELRAAAQLDFLRPSDHVRCGDTGTWALARDVHRLFDRP